MDVDVPALVKVTFRRRLAFNVEVDVEAEVKVALRRRVMLKVLVLVPPVPVPSG